MMKRHLIIIGGGLLQVPLIKTAIDMELVPIVFDMSDNALGMQLASIKKVQISTRDIEGCVRESRKLARKLSIHGVITAATDASRTVAAIASALGLLGIRFADAEACSNKILMRRRLRKHKIPIPDFTSVWSLQELRAEADKLNFPLVLKPAENMGSRGVIKINRRQDINAAFRHTKKYSSTGEMILEEFMIGAELSIDALCFQGEVIFTGIADRLIVGEPYFIELGHNMPSAQTKEVIAEAKAIMKSAIDALNINTGAAKGDLKITPTGIQIGEVASRLSGGFMSSHTYPLHSGNNLLKAAIQISLGKKPKLSDEGLDEEYSFSSKPIAIERSIVCAPGRIVKLRGEESMTKCDGIDSVYITRKEGDIMPQLTSNVDKVGHIIAYSHNLLTAELAVKKAMSYLELEVDESYGIDWPDVKLEARQKFSDQVCWVCKVCDGMNCASGVPGMGGVGNMESFRDNSRAIAEIQIMPRYIRNDIKVDSSIELFGRRFDFPIMAAPMTGMITNMNSALSEYEIASILLKSCRESGTIAFLGDGASPNTYLTIIEALSNMDGFGILICKPRTEKTAIAHRFQLAREAGAVAVGMDIDAISFKTMQLKRQATVARNQLELKEIRELTPLPFILKGIMSVEDAMAAIEIGADAIVVSNHGGRVLDNMPGTARVLAEIVEAVGSKIIVLADGGVRSGQDAFKFLSLGAKAVLVGRPVVIAAVGGGLRAVKNMFLNYAEDFRASMNLCGTSSLSELDSKYLRIKKINKNKKSL